MVGSHLCIVSFFSHLIWERLPKIKAWIDENNPGDPLIPFSVALEERLGRLSPEEKKEEEQKLSTTSALPKITQAGYSSLDVRRILYLVCEIPADLARSSSVISPVGQMKFVPGQFAEAQRHLRLLVSSTLTLRTNLFAVKLCLTMISKNTEAKPLSRLPASSDNRASHMKVSVLGETKNVSNSCHHSGRW